MKMKKSGHPNDKTYKRQKYILTPGVKAVFRFSNTEFINGCRYCLFKHHIFRSKSIWLQHRLTDHRRIIISATVIARRFPYCNHVSRVSMIRNLIQKSA